MKLIITTILGLFFLAAPAFATRYALLAGIDEYDEKYDASSLCSCVNDAKGMRNCLISDSINWSDSNITLLTNGLATKTAIRNRLHALALTAGSGDTVLYFQSGHGGQHSGTDTYLCSYNDNYEDEELAEDLAQFDSGVKVIIVIDACFSGGLFKSAGITSAGTKSDWNFAANVTRHQRAQKSMATKAASIGWITACNYDETSSAGTSYSLFAGFLIYGFAYADADNDAFLSFQELHDYAKPRTLLANPDQSVQLFNGSTLTATQAAAVVPFDVHLKTALDQPSIQIYAQPGPANCWYSQTQTAHAGSSSIQSGAIPHGQASEFGTRITGPGTLSFTWKTSSEEKYDVLFFYDNEQSRAGISGETEWTDNTLSLGPGEHLLRWIYAKDALDSYGDDCGWVDQMVWTPDDGYASSQITDALDRTLLPTFTSLESAWSSQTAVTHDGNAAARSGVCADNQCSWFSTKIIGPCNLSFWRKVSSEDGYDTLTFSIDDEIKTCVSGELSWQQETYSISMGPHTLWWIYSKDAVEKAGSDCAWIDQVVWTGECDGDGDGLPSGWEEDHGLDPADMTGGNGTVGNPDGDELNNLQEYICGTDPMNEASCFRIISSSAHQTSSGFKIEWESQPNRSYRVYWAANMTQPFELLEDGIDYPRNSYTDTLHSVNTECFYKVDVQRR